MSDRIYGSVAQHRVSSGRPGFDITVGPPLDVVQPKLDYPDSLEPHEIVRIIEGSDN